MGTLGGMQPVSGGHSAFLYENRREREKKMRIAVPVENGMIFQHFGKSKEFAIYETAEGKTISKRRLEAGENGHSALVGLLREAGAELVICGGIGGGARDALQAAGLEVAAGVSGSADEAVERFLTGTLSFDNAATCGHHGHLHLPGHSCGGHTCGNHTCGE